MENKAAPINIQDDFLNRIRRDKLTIHIYLVNGKKLIGKVRAFDRFTVQLVNGASEQLVFKHAIASILIADPGVRMTEPERLRVIRSIFIFSELDEPHLRDILAHCRELDVEKGQVIVSENTPGDSLFVIMDGNVKVSVISSEGKEIILSTLKGGEFFGEMSLLDGATRSANVISLSKAHLLRLSREDFLSHILPNREIAAGVLAVMSRRLRAANERITNLIALDVFDRLARYFKREAGEKGRLLIDGSVVFERLPQSDIASIIGSSRETVTRMIREMVDQGLVAVSGRNIILKRDFDERLESRHRSS